jgi:hypothetical protein
MTFIRLIPVFFSFLLIAAHFQRAGLTLLAITCLFIPGLLYFTRPWSIHIVRVFLLMAAIEWIRTLVFLVNLRLDAGLPWQRLAIIIGGVALFTVASALVFQHGEIKRKYGISRTY